MSAKARRAFEEWWTAGDSRSPTGRLALASPITELTWQTFLAGWNAHKNRADNKTLCQAEGTNQT